MIEAQKSFDDRPFWFWTMHSGSSIALIFLLRLIVGEVNLSLNLFRSNFCLIQMNEKLFTSQLSYKE